jgi:hypothetical protein
LAKAMLRRTKNKNPLFYKTDILVKTFVKILIELAFIKKIFFFRLLIVFLTMIYFH